MMNSSEECSSGCESGWTLYLEEHSFRNQVEVEEEEGTDEDLSMVSDASSGPPLFSNDQDGSFFNGSYSSSAREGTLSSTSSGDRMKKHQNKKNKKKEKVTEQGGQGQIRSNQLTSMACNFLDDTASSPAFNNNNTTSIPNHHPQLQAPIGHVLDYSNHAFSATHFQQRGSGEYGDDQFGYVQPSFSGNYFQNHQWF